MSYNERETKLKKEKKNKKFPLYPLYVVGSATDGLSLFKGFICGISSRSGVHRQATPHVFPLTNLRHSLLSCTILLVCLASKLLFMVSIYLFRGIPTEQLSAHSLAYSVLAIIFYILSTSPNQWDSIHPPNTKQTS